ncbi:MAG: hypothetical protein ABEJ84_03775 [Halodesulfurarchaeum sp.]
MTTNRGPSWKRFVLVPSVFFAAGLLIGGAVTALLEPRMAFSLLLGIPAGLLAGVVAAGAVAVGLTSENSRRRQIGRGIAGFSLAFLSSFAAALLALDLGTVVSLGLALVIGLAGSAFAVRRGPPETAEHPSSKTPN